MSGPDAIWASSDDKSVAEARCVALPGAEELHLPSSGPDPLLRPSPDGQEDRGHENRRGADGYFPWRRSFDPVPRNAPEMVVH